MKKRSGQATDGVSSLCFVQCFDTVGWVRERTFV